jgi:4'-phosphopantetheinyl transferase EntD
MLERLVPPVVATEEAYADVPGSLLPAEAALMASATPGRRAEFGTVRHCARRAMSRLGVPGAARTVLAPGPHREPRWPAGLVGSLTHCAGYRAAAVARADAVPGLGIDAEPHAPLPPGVADRVTRAEERESLAALAAAQPGVHWDRMVFSAKESVYKVWFPLTGRWLGFEDASVAPRPDGTFSVRLVDRVLPVAGTMASSLSGRWLVERGLMITALVLPSAVS